MRFQFKKKAKDKETKEKYIATMKGASQRQQKKERNRNSSNVGTIREHLVRPSFHFTNLQNPRRVSTLISRARSTHFHMYTPHNINRSIKRQSEWSNLKQRAVRGSRIWVARQPRAPNHNRMQFRNGRNRQYRVLRSVNHPPRQEWEDGVWKLQWVKWEGGSAYLNYNIPTSWTQDSCPVRQPTP